MADTNSFEQALVDIIVDLEIASRTDVQAMSVAFSEQNKGRFDVFLLEEGLLLEQDLLRVLSVYYQVPSFDVVGHFFDTTMLHKFPKGFLLRNAIIPLELDEDILVVVTSDPSRVGLESSIREHVSYDITFFVGLERDICNAVKEFYDQSLTNVDLDVDIRDERQREDDFDRIGSDEDDDA